MSVSDRWHKAYPKEDEPRCREHNLVATVEHGQGDRWQVRYRDDTGRQRKKNLPKKGGSDPNTCAAAFDAKIQEQLNTQTYVDPSKGKVKVRPHAEQWLSTLTQDIVSRRNIESRFSNHVYPLIGNDELGELAKRPSLAQRWIKRMETELELSPQTIHDTVGWVSMMYNAAVDDGIVPRNPFRVSSVRTPKIVESRPQPWSLQQVHAASKALPDHLQPIPYLGSGCGHRIGEMLGVGIDDLDFDAHTIDVNRQVRFIGGRPVFRLPKGDKIRNVPMPDEVESQIKRHMKEFPPIAVTLPWGNLDGKPATVKLIFFHHIGVGPVRREYVDRAWLKSRAAAGASGGGRKNGFHVLRHTAASAWLAAGVDIRTVAAFLGHSNPAFTLRVYSHLMPDAADRARKAMDLFFNG